MNLQHLRFLLDVSNNPRLEPDTLSATRYRCYLDVAQAGLVSATPHLRLTERGVEILVLVENHFNVLMEPRKHG